MQRINTVHFHMGCRAGTLLPLLYESRHDIDPERRAQVALLAAVSVAMTPFALMQELVYGKRLKETVIDKPPLFVLGYWRSGTTYLQNMLSRDEQFGWADPVHNVLLPYSLIAPGLFRKSVEKGIGAGRPMDNVQYRMDLPMEETLGMLTISPYSIIHMLAFPMQHERFIRVPFVGDLPLAEQERWAKSYDKVLKLLTYVHGGRRLVLKSPDNTAHARLLWERYPDCRFINIHRDPYKSIRSAVNMIFVQMKNLRLTREPENVEEVLEDALVDIFRRMYEEWFALEAELPENRYCDIAYKDFCADPIGTLRDVYARLELDGFAEAEPRFAAFAESQNSYRKNSFDISPRLTKKINDKLGFYFDHYGYTMREVSE